MELASYIGAGIGILLIFVVCYFEFFAPEIITPPAEETQTAVSDETPEPAADGTAELAAGRESEREPPLENAQTEEDAGPYQGVVAPGDTAGALLGEWLSVNDIHDMVEACKNVYPLSRLRAGQPYTVYKENGSFVRFEYEIDDDSKLIAGRENSGETTRWTARVENIEYEVRLVKVEGEISSSLFESMSSIGESPALAVRLAEVFAWEINFIRDIQPGDSFRVLVEKRYRDGELKGYGAMPLAEFINKNSKFEAYRFQDSFGNATYFNASGDSLKRAFLKAPLSFTRISSRFNLKRMHPIFHTVRPHPAVDYAAPKGTPVKAIGSGIVAFCGFNKGAGNYITLQHGNGYESMYLHLNGFAKKLKKGVRVRQGETIGYVGSTGYSTGPHLDFRMKKNGQFVNPEKTLSPRDESVPKKLLGAFKADRDTWRRYLEGERSLTEYSTRKETQVR
jgi:murein DD-endopeptidase MepM/ murein hydrolase activator NlpD